MSFSEFVKNITGYLTGEALVGALDQIKGTVEDTTRKVVKSLALFVMFVIGMIFLLVGLANYIQAKFIWTDGLGLIIVGAVIILLGFFAKMMR